MTVSIPNLTLITDAAIGDDVILETVAGTRRISRENFQYRRSELALLTPSNISTPNDVLWLSDATDGTLKGVLIGDVMFGNFAAVQETDGFALDPAIHNVQPIECAGTFTTAIITISNTTTDIGGASFELFNFSTTGLTVSAIDAMTMFEDGAAVASATFRENTAATIQVNSAGDECIFAGG
ncbi:hypothetical protein N9980_01930 [bacterium]|nr:hypothetical protein [bacterium]